MARAYRAAGFFVVRSPQSGSAIDLLAVKYGYDGNLDTHAHDVHFVQCKLGGRLRPAEREELIALAEEFGAVPVLAYGKNPICRRDLREGGSELAPLERPNPSRTVSPSDPEVPREV